MPSDGVQHGALLALGEVHPCHHLQLLSNFAVMKSTNIETVDRLNQNYMDVYGVSPLIADLQTNTNSKTTVSLR